MLTAYEAGRCQQAAPDQSDPVHAARNTLNGLMAMCGAGRIAAVVPGKFDSAGQDVCPACRDALHGGG